MHNCFSTQNIRLPLNAYIFIHTHDFTNNDNPDKKYSHIFYQNMIKKRRSHIWVRPTQIHITTNNNNPDKKYFTYLKSKYYKKRRYIYLCDMLDHTNTYYNKHIFYQNHYQYGLGYVRAKNKAIVFPLSFNNKIIKLFGHSYRD